MVNDRISVSQPVSGVRRVIPSPSTSQNSAHSTDHCSHSRPIVGSWNLTMLVSLPATRAVQDLHRVFVERARAYRGAPAKGAGAPGPVGEDNERYPAG